MHTEKMCSVAINFLVMCVCVIRMCESISIESAKRKTLCIRYFSN